MGCGRDHLSYRKPGAINTICTRQGGGHHLRFIDCDPTGRGGYSGEALAAAISGREMQGPTKGENCAGINSHCGPVVVGNRITTAVQ